MSAARKVRSYGFAGTECEIAAFYRRAIDNRPYGVNG